jgi:glycosyltransferase involved in cell wall biosynthesis
MHVKYTCKIMQAVAPSVSNSAEAITDSLMTQNVKQKVVVIMPAYNAARTLKMTYMELPREVVDLVLLVDDGSTDQTLEIARELGLEIFLHNRNYGYGGNQKTCYVEALKAEADVIVMVHPDYQYDPTCLPQIIDPIQRREADVVLGSRLMGVSPIKQGMPWWKYYGNRLLTTVENRVFGLRLCEYHTGYRAYSRHVLETINFQVNSDRFIFDQEVIAQIVDAKFRIKEIPVPVRYFPEASSASLTDSVRYGLGILWLMLRYWLHKHRWIEQRKFQSLKRRYSRFQETTDSDLTSVL